MSRPTEAMKTAWLEAYGTLSELSVQGYYFVVRPLTRGEYKACERRAGQNKAALNEALAQAGCLWPQQFPFSSSEILASIPHKVAAEIKGLSARDEHAALALFNKWQNKMAKQEERWDLLIQLAFPHIRQEELDDLLPEQYFRMLAAADFRTRTQIKTTVNPVFFDPEEFVDMLLCSEGELKARLEQYEQDKQSDGQPKEAAQPAMPAGVEIPPGMPVQVQNRNLQEEFMRTGNVSHDEIVEQLTGSMKSAPYGAKGGFR